MSLAIGIAYRFRLWLTVLRYVRPAGWKTLANLVVSIVHDALLFLIHRGAPIMACGGIVFLRSEDVYFRVRPRTDDFYSVIPHREGEIEKFILDSLECGGVFVDVGANIGYYTIIASKQVGDNGKVLAIEPIRETVDILNENVFYLNGLRNVRVVNKAAWNVSNEEIRMRIPHCLGKIGIFGGSAVVSHHERSSDSHVSTVTLDDLTSDIAECDMLKIDTEGAENEILEGATQLLSRTRFVYVECDKKNAHSVQSVLNRAGFSCRLNVASHAIHMMCTRM